MKYIDSCVPCPSFAEDKKRVQKSQCNTIPAKGQTLAKKGKCQPEFELYISSNVNFSKNLVDFQYVYDFLKHQK